MIHDEDKMTVQSLETAARILGDLIQAEAIRAFDQETPPEKREQHIIRGHAFHEAIDALWRENLPEEQYEKRRDRMLKKYTDFKKNALAVTLPQTDRRERNE